MLQDYKPQLDTPKRQGRLALVYLRASFTDGSGAFTLSTDNSSPKVTLARDGAGQYTMTFPKSQFAHLVGIELLLAEAGTGNFAQAESITPATGGVGTLVFETSNTKGTAADPASGSVLFITLLVGGN